MLTTKSSFLIEFCVARPQKLVDRYQQLYDNLWIDAFDGLSESYKDVEEIKKLLLCTEIICILLQG
jgi:hypothetical protein